MRFWVRLGTFCVHIYQHCLTFWKKVATCLHKKKIFFLGIGVQLVATSEKKVATCLHKHVNKSTKPAILGVFGHILCFFVATLCNMLNIFFNMFAPKKIFFFAFDVQHVATWKKKLQHVCTSMLHKVENLRFWVCLGTFCVNPKTCDFGGV